MDNKLFTALEIAVIGGLILIVMYFGGVFGTDVKTTATPARVDLPSPTAGTPRPTRTLRPTDTPAPTPTIPPLTQPAGLIAFNRHHEIYVMNADGSDQRNLTNDPADDYLLAWSPDGSQIAFFSTRTDWLELYVMEADGSNVVQVSHTKDSQTAYRRPVSWTPDGSAILALRASPWDMGRYDQIIEFDLIRTDGSGAKTIFWSNQSLWGVSLSPNGQYVAMIMTSEEGYGVHVARLTDEGLMQPQLASQACYDYIWAPIASRLTCSDGLLMFTINVDGSDKISLFTRSPSDYGNGSRLLWSPNGQLLLHQDAFYGPDGILSSGLSLVLPEGGHREVVRGFRLSISAGDPPAMTWAPDSQWIAFASDQFDSLDIFSQNIYNPNSLRQLTATGGNFSPLWQPSP